MCPDGRSICGYIAIFLKWWLEGANPDVDPVKQIREKEKDYIAAKSKEQRQQLRQLIKYARDIQKWHEYYKKK
jgi:hypothetical protein